MSFKTLYLVSPLFEVSIPIDITLQLPRIIDKLDIFQTFGAGLLQGARL